METPTTLAIDMPLHRAKRAAQAILPHVGTDDVTPVLTAAQFTNGHLVGTDRYSVGRIRLSSDEARPDRSLVGLAVKYGGISEERYADQVKAWEDNHEVRYYADGERTEEAPEFMVPRALITRMAGLSGALLPISGNHALQPARVRVEVHEPAFREAVSGEKKHIGWDWADLVLFDGDRAVLRQSFLNVSGNYPPVGRLMDEWKPAEEPGALNFTPWNLAKITKFAGRYEMVVLTAGKSAFSHTKLAPTRLTIGSDFVALIQPNLDMR